jgi:multiple antibiotic resistance protein
MADKLFHDLVTLFVVVNPIGVVPLFVALAGHESAAARRRIVGQAILISTVILFVFIGIGQIVLEALGIDLASFRIAGGLVLLIIALRMVLQEAHDPKADSSAIYGNIAVFPLAMPFIAGPASIMAVVLLTDNNVYTVWQEVETAALLVVVLGFTYGCLVGADFVQPLLGSTGANVVSRIMGLTLAALAVQSILSGFHDILHGEVANQRALPSS